MNDSTKNAKPRKHERNKITKKISHRAMGHRAVARRTSAGKAARREAAACDALN
jgi:hypothetical protein